MTDTQRKAFLDAWIEDVKEDYARYGAKSLVPKALLWSILAGIVVALWAPEQEFYRKPEVSIVFMTALVTVDGLLIALSWTSFGKIYEIASRAKFAAFLRRRNMLNAYFFHVDYIHFMQIIAISISSATTAALILKDAPFFILKAGLALSIATSAYAFKNAQGAVKIMQDLVWYSSIFEEVGDNLTDRNSGAIPMRESERGD